MKYFLFIIGVGISAGVLAQSETTNNLHKKYEDSWSLFFYNNTLRMLNQSEDPEFDKLIKDIEKMKFLMIDKQEHAFGQPQYANLVSVYRKEAYENIMTSRFEGRNFDVYLKEKGGTTQGMVVLVNDSTNLFVLDILGKIDLSNITTLYKTLDENEISKRLQSIKKVKEQAEKKDPD